MNRKDRRKSEALTRKGLRLINGGKVDRATLAKAVARDGDDKLPPAKKFSEALAMLMGAWEEADKALPEERRCSDADKLGVLMNMSANLALRMEVPYDQFMDGAGVVYEEQEKQLADE